MISDEDAFKRHLMDIFKGEARQRVNKVRTYISQMAKSTSSDTVESAYREVHSLKAAAGLVELEEMAQLTQTMERAFLAVKRDPGMLRLQMGSLLDDASATLVTILDAAERGAITIAEREQAHAMVLRLDEFITDHEAKLERGEASGAS